MKTQSGNNVTQFELFNKESVLIFLFSVCGDLN